MAITFAVAASGATASFLLIARAASPEGSMVLAEETQTVTL
jgi:hypothetical protein